MKLSEWLKDTGTTQEMLAKRAKTTQGRISQLLQGDSPSMDLAARIYAATDGAVTANDWMPEQAVPMGDGAVSQKVVP